MTPADLALRELGCLPKLPKSFTNMKLSKLCAFSKLALLSVFVVSCSGYQLGSVKPTSLSHVESVAVPTFTNKTLEPRSHVLVTNEVIKQLQRDGTFRVADPKRGGDAILRGTITDIERRQLRGSRTDVLRTTETEISVRIDFVLEDAESGAELDRGGVVGKTSAYLDENHELTERQALQLAAEDAALKVVSRIAEGY